MKKMMRLFAALPLMVSLVLLSACGNQATVRKVASEAMAAYQVSGGLADVYLKSGLATPATAKVIARASAAAVKPLDTLGAEIAAGSSVSDAEVATALAAIAALQSAINTAQTEAAAASAANTGSK